MTHQLARAAAVGLGICIQVARMMPVLSIHREVIIWTAKLATRFGPLRPAVRAKVTAAKSGANPPIHMDWLLVESRTGRFQRQSQLQFQESGLGRERLSARTYLFN